MNAFLIPLGGGKMRTIVISVTSVFLLALGQVFWKIGLNQIGDVSFDTLMPSLVKLFSNLWFIFGCIISLASSILWMIALKIAPLNEVFPYFALSYIFVFALSWLLLKEPINTMKLWGMLVICIGVFSGVMLIAFSGKN